MGPTLVFRSTYGRVLTLATGAVAVALGVSTALTGDVGALVGALVPAALVTYLVWMLFWRPAVEVSDGGVEVRNVTRTVHVPWTAYEGVEARYSLEVRHTGGTVTAWAAPRSSGSARWLRRSRRRPVDRERVVTGANAETVAEAVAQRHGLLAAAGHLDRAVPGAPGARTTWHVVQLAVLGALAVGTVVVLTA
ncbi:PH domain-containing protein [Cellulosimicrobium protaetiae]|uniref:PH domain-containing protein n=1 Tax=Cellulosimicrobium protaetiae TaxID=2587808 RepID=A0A6M5UJR5_9MICO|nr:PH domain-containing protein [Cellulosimicrobium protaetiae]QJW37328.1 PH domain-containing protein [Cellulosimicrobium protaetiae]